MVESWEDYVLRTATEGTVEYKLNHIGVTAFVGNYSKLFNWEELSMAYPNIIKMFVDDVLRSAAE